MKRVRLILLLVAAVVVAGGIAWAIAMPSQKPTSPQVMLQAKVSGYIKDDRAIRVNPGWKVTPIVEVTGLDDPSPTITLELTSSLQPGTRTPIEHKGAPGVEPIIKPGEPIRLVYPGLYTLVARAQSNGRFLGYSDPLEITVTRVMEPRVVALVTNMRWTSNLEGLTGIEATVLLSTKWFDPRRIRFFQVVLAGSHRDEDLFTTDFRRAVEESSSASLLVTDSYQRAPNSKSKRITAWYPKRAQAEFIDKGIGYWKLHMQADLSDDPQHPHESPLKWNDWNIRGQFQTDEGWASFVNPAFLPHEPLDDPEAYFFSLLEAQPPPPQRWDPMNEYWRVSG